MKKVFLVSVFLLAQISLLVADQTRKQLTVELVSIQDALIEPSITEISWKPDSTEVTYFKQNGKKEDEIQSLWSFDVNTFKERLLFDPKEEKFKLTAYEWSPKGDLILLQEEKDLWLLDPKTGTTEQLTKDADPEDAPTFSPAGDRIAFVRKNNLYTINLSTKALEKLTSDGSDVILNGKLDWVYEEELSFRGTGRGYEWSPDGKKIFYLRLDESKVQKYPLTDPSIIPVPVEWEHYPKAGSPNPVPSVHIVKVGDKENKNWTTKLNSGVEYVGPRFSWTADSKNVAFTTMNRAQTELKVHLWNPELQKASELLTETDPYWLDSTEPPRFLKNKQQFLWFSHRDGWLHVYLYGNDGKLEKQLTKGKWMMEQIAENQTFADEPNDWIYFASTAPDPRERHIYRIHFDGTGLEQLSIEPGTHKLQLSPDGKLLINIFSSATKPPEVYLLKPDGSLLAKIDAPKSQLAEFSFSKPEWIELKAADGTELYSVLWKPQEFDQSKKYPVIIYVYGGPWGQEVRNRWSNNNLLTYLFTQNGFLVWTLDNRGTPGRGHEFQSSAIYKRSGEIELQDQLTGVDYLKSLSFVDPSRIGIWGWSYGGYFTLYATTHSDVFKCAISGAPVTDWKYYDTIYTERYMKTPQENAEGYKKASVLESAKNLQTNLLLIHGLADDNVHPQNTVNFIEALIKARKPYQLHLQPGQKHGFETDDSLIYVHQRMLDFFKNNL
jgi:dipeptidyl-peptidase-4